MQKKMKTNLVRLSNATICQANPHHLLASVYVHGYKICCGMNTSSVAAYRQACSISRAVGHRGIQGKCDGPDNCPLAGMLSVSHPSPKEKWHWYDSLFRSCCCLHMAAHVFIKNPHALYRQKESSFLAFAELQILLKELHLSSVA